MPVCPECGGKAAYLTSYCNYLHCLVCGEAIEADHEECWVPPSALQAELAGDSDRAIAILKQYGA